MLSTVYIYTLLDIVKMICCICFCLCVCLPKWGNPRMSPMGSFCQI